MKHCNPVPTPRSPNPHTSHYWHRPNQRHRRIASPSLNSRQSRPRRAAEAPWFLTVQRSPSQAAPQMPLSVDVRHRRLARTAGTHRRATHRRASVVHVRAPSPTRARRRRVPRQGPGTSLAPAAARGTAGRRALQRAIRDRMTVRLQEAGSRHLPAQGCRPPIGWGVSTTAVEGRGGHSPQGIGGGGDTCPARETLSQVVAQAEAQRSRSHPRA